MYFSHGFQQLSDRVLKTMITSAKNRHLPGWCPAKFRIMQYFAEPTAATLKGCGCALQQNLDKATKDKKQNFSDHVFV